MDREMYSQIEKYMLECMNDVTHDAEHIYRVLYVAIDIAENESGVDYDVLIAACLLHDIGRLDQFRNPEVNHADAGSVKAFEFLKVKGWSEEKATAVKSAVMSHSYRAGKPPVSLEGKILFDADKIDVMGAIGIARTILYKGQVGEPLYRRLPDGSISDGTDDIGPSVLREYKYKLEKLYDHLYTERGRVIAENRRNIAVRFYEALLLEVGESASKFGLLSRHIES